MFKKGETVWHVDDSGYCLAQVDSYAAGFFAIHKYDTLDFSGHAELKLGVKPQQLMRFEDEPKTLQQARHMAELAYTLVKQSDGDSSKAALIPLSNNNFVCLCPPERRKLNVHVFDDATQEQLIEQFLKPDTVLVFEGSSGKEKQALFQQFASLFVTADVEQRKARKVLNLGLECLKPFGNILEKKRVANVMPKNIHYSCSDDGMLQSIELEVAMFEDALFHAQYKSSETALDLSNYRLEMLYLVASSFEQNMFTEQRNKYHLLDKSQSYSLFKDFHSDRQITDLTIFMWLDWMKKIGAKEEQVNAIMNLCSACLLVFHESSEANCAILDTLLGATTPGWANNTIQQYGALPLFEMCISTCVKFIVHLVNEKLAEAIGIPLKSHKPFVTLSFVPECSDMLASCSWKKLYVDAFKFASLNRNMEQEYMSMKAAWNDAKVQQLPSKLSIQGELTIAGSLPGAICDYIGAVGGNVIASQFCSDFATNFSTTLKVEPKDKTRMTLEFSSKSLSACSYSVFGTSKHPASMLSNVNCTTLNMLKFDMSSNNIDPLVWISKKLARIEQSLERCQVYYLHCVPVFQKDQMRSTSFSELCNTLKQFSIYPLLDMYTKSCTLKVALNENKSDLYPSLAISNDDFQFLSHETVAELGIAYENVLYLLSNHLQLFSLVKTREPTIDQDLNWQIPEAIKAKLPPLLIDEMSNESDMSDDDSPLPSVAMIDQQSPFQQDDSHFYRVYPEKTATFMLRKTTGRVPQEMLQLQVIAKKESWNTEAKEFDTDLLLLFEYFHKVLKLFATNSKKETKLVASLAPLLNQATNEGIGSIRSLLQDILEQLFNMTDPQYKIVEYARHAIRVSKLLDLVVKLLDLSLNKTKKTKSIFDDATFHHHFLSLCLVILKNVTSCEHSCKYLIKIDAPWKVLSALDTWMTVSPPMPLPMLTQGYVVLIEMSRHENLASMLKDSLPSTKTFTYRVSNMFLNVFGDPTAQDEPAFSKEIAQEQMLSCVKNGIVQTSLYTYFITMIKAYSFLFLNRKAPLNSILQLLVQMLARSSIHMAVICGIFLEWQKLDSTVLYRCIHQYQLLHILFKYTQSFEQATQKQAIITLGALGNKSQNPNCYQESRKLMHMWFPKSIHVQLGKLWKSLAEQDATLVMQQLANATPTDIWIKQQQDKLVV